ncbi:MAG: TolC family outer membrane protein [Steroidobacteraceae bacterium]
MKRNWIVCVVGACIAGPAAAENLLQVYDQALTADPTMQQASATHMATRETKTQAILNMLPLDVYASKDWSGVQHEGTTQSSAIGTVGLQVNLFQWSNWIALKAANATVAQGEADYAAARQDLIQRVATLYFAVLYAEDNLTSQQSALQSVARQLEQAERRFEVGLIAVTDVQSARASRDSTAAAVIAARRSLSSAQEQLRAVTTRKYDKLSAPGNDMPLLTPDPASEDSWVSTAMSQNASLIASRMSAEISHDSYLSAFGGHLPSITVAASRNWDLDGDRNNSVSQSVVNTQDITWSVGVTVPIFTAGATQSKVRQANYTYKAAQAALERTSRSTEQQARDAYQGVISQIAQVQALKQAVESNRVALQATEAGYDVGTKTALDVLTARQSLVAAETSYASAKYSYLNNIIELRLAAGNLDRTTLEQINGWLTETASETPDASPDAANTPATPGAQ